MGNEPRSVHPRALPNYQNAVIPRSKLEDYALSPAHTEGRHKALLFKSILGFEKTDWEKLAKTILDELPYYEALPAGEGPWGEKYLVALPIEGLNGNIAIVETVWIIIPENGYPSFVTPRTIREREVSHYRNKKSSRIGDRRINGRFTGVWSLPGCKRHGRRGL